MREKKSNKMLKLLSKNTRNLWPLLILTVTGCATLSPSLTQCPVPPPPPAELMQPATEYDYWQELRNWRTKASNWLQGQIAWQTELRKLPNHVGQN